MRHSSIGADEMRTSSSRLRFPRPGKWRKLVDIFKWPVSVSVSVCLGVSVCKGVLEEGVATLPHGTFNFSSVATPVQI